jgi:hypothetical protein
MTTLLIVVVVLMLFGGVWLTDIAGGSNGSHSLCGQNLPSDPKAVVARVLLQHSVL